MTARRWSVALASATLLALVAGCTSDADSSTSDSPSAGLPSTGVASTAAVPSSGTATTPPASSASGSATASRKPTATPSVVPTRAQTTAAPVPIRSRASFGGGLSARLVSFKKTKVTDRGPGALTGRSATEFTIEFRNTSSRAVSLATVQVNAEYGDDLSASPVNQNEGAAQGKVGAGRTARGVYTFAIPTNELDKVEVAVAIDPQRPTVVFAGAVS